MSNFVKQALEKYGLWEAYKERLHYQQNDYIGWITRVKREETRKNRLDQMLDELKRENSYMNMKWQSF